MAETFSFDIVSEVNLQEVDNAVNQAIKEITTRFDFKGSKSSIDFNRAEKKITLVSDDELKLKTVRELLYGKLNKRGISAKSVTAKPVEKAESNTVRQVLEIVMGIEKEKAKELVKIIKGLNLRVQAQIDDTKVRVFSSKKDELQAVIQHLRSADFPVALQFTNYR